MSKESDEDIEPEVGGLRMPSTDDTDSVVEDDCGLDLGSEVNYEQLKKLASYDQIENRVYTHDEVEKLIQSHEGLSEPSHDKAVEMKGIIDNAYKKSLKRYIAVLKKKSERLWDSENEKDQDQSSKIDDIVDLLEIKLDEFIEDLETQKEEAEDHNQHLIDIVFCYLDEVYEELREPTQKQVQACIDKLHETNPGWDSEDKSHYDHVELLGQCLKETFPELDKNSKRLAVPKNKQAQPSTQTPQIFINQPSSVPTTPQKPTQQIVYTSKKAVSKDKVGLGCLLEAIGICLFFLTLFTIIGPLVGLALFGCGYAIARQKRYVCRNCGNSLAPEAKICPTCSAVYTIGVFQILMKCVRFFMLIALFLFLYSLFTGKWDGMQKSAMNWLEEKFESDSSSEINDNELEQLEVMPKPEVKLPEIEPTDLIAQRDWTDLQGRTLEASLIDALRRADGSYYGKFRKPDGTEFEYDVLKLSKPDRALIKKVLVQEGRIIE